MNTSVSRNADGPSLAGPHVCSLVGANVSKLLRAAMMEMCERRGGKLSKDEIVHVFDVVTQSSALFPVFQKAYSNCVGLQKSSPFAEVDGTTISRFVIGAYCRDVIARVFKAQIKARGTHWTHAFIGGFMTFLTTDIRPELEQELFSVYKTLALSCSGPMTPVTILNSQDVIDALSRATRRMNCLSKEDGAFLKRFETTVNGSIAPALKLRGPCMENINVVSASAFMTRLSEQSDTNPFRALVQQAPD